MKLIDGKMTIIEVAPGIDLQKDILDLMDFEPAISPELKTMDPGIFSEKWGGLDMTCLGLGECDSHGNINVSRLGGNMVGPGGFIDITNATPKVVFCGTFMGKAKLAIGDGKLTIVQEGKVRKFPKDVDQITFAGKYIKPGQDVVYVTERCVMKLIDGTMTITEIAPGIDLQKDILDLMDFTPAVAPDCKLMDERIFCETWGGLNEIFG